MASRFPQRRLSLTVAVVAALSVALIAPTVSADAQASAAASSNTCGAVLHPAANGHVYGIDGTDLTSDPEFALPLSRGARWVSADHMKCVTTQLQGGALTPTSTQEAPGSGAANSTNWAGYTHGASSPSSVSASFYVKTITGSNGDQALSWVGLGGSPATPLIQDGIHYSISSTGTKSARLWWEIWPNVAIQDISNGIGMTWGDQVNMTVRYANGTDTFTFYDYRTNKSQSLQKTSSNPGGTAECITEREGHFPDNGTYYPLAKYGTQTFTSCIYQLTGSTTPHVVASGGTAWNTIQNGVTYQTTGSPSGTYGNFTVTWRHR